MNTDDLKGLAGQLRQPTGQKGIELADMMNETNIAMTRHAIDLLTISENDVILELGHGNGKHLPYLLDQHNTAQYYGLEISSLMNEEAKRIHQHFVEQQRASYFLYDGIHIPFTDHFFTKIFTVNTIYFWTDPKALLKELYRILKPSGIVNITFVQEDSMKLLPFTQFEFTLYTNDKIKQLLSETSFSWINDESKTEIVKNKIGQEITRTFTTVTLKK